MYLVRKLFVVFLFLSIIVGGIVLFDYDEDGLSPIAEVQEGTDIFVADSDGDGLLDGEEVRQYGTDPLETDTDGDGVNDSREMNLGLNPTSSDTDSDGINDGAEVENDTDPDAKDTDSDGLDDWEEQNEYGTSPIKSDSDEDGLTDGEEVTQYETDPLDADMDGDGLLDGTEIELGADPEVVDTDSDGVSDGNEHDNGSDPTKVDTDSDGFDDNEEITVYETDPNASDSDDDGLTDVEEVNTYGTDPTVADTDGDGLSDGIEITDVSGIGTTDPLQKDVFIEVDSMSGTGLSDSEKSSLVNEFKTAPVENPGGESGITLHIHEDSSSIERASRTTEEDYYGDVISQNFDHAGRGYWHVGIVENAYEEEKEIIGKYRIGHSGMLVEHGPRERTGTTLMHELGHALGLLPEDFRGIDSNIESRSDYPSVMNYNRINAYGYSDGDNSDNDYDDWGYIETNMSTPPTGELDIENKANTE